MPSDPHGTPQPDLDSGLTKIAERVADRLGGREVVLEFVMGETNYWRAIVYPTREAIARRLQTDESHLTEGQIFALENRPIGSGKGATRSEAVANVQPVTWRH